MLTRFGLDRSMLGVGVEIRDDVVLVAMARRNRVVGLGYLALSAGAVVRGDVREPARLGTGLADLLADLHVVRPPRVAVSLAPAVAVPEHTVSATSSAGGTIHAGRRAVEAARHVATSIGALSHVESTPISLVRFAELAQPRQPGLFLRGGVTEGRWTAQWHDSTIEIELDPQVPGPNRAVVGPDLGTLAEPDWGAVDVARDLRRTEAGTAPVWATAVGASFGALGVGPTLDLAQALDSDRVTTGTPGGWTTEQIA